jgi:HEAT repeat protein
VTASCPTCGKPVDPLRAPAVTVRAGRIVGYCSKECASAAESKPVAVAAVPASTPTPTSAPAPTPAPAAAAAPTPAPTPEKKPAASPVPIAMRRTPAGVVQTPATNADSGPVIEIIREPTAPVVRATPVPDKKRAPTDGAIQVAETGHLDDYVDPDDDDAGEPRKSRTALYVVVVLLLVGGGAFFVYKQWFLHNDAHSATTKLDPPATPPAPTQVKEPPPVEPSKVETPKGTAALERARAVLAKQLHDATPRVQRDAAAALSRTGDRDAIAALVAMLGKDTNEMGRLYYAHWLARAGDARGSDALFKALAAERRETRLEAARYLAWLGDKRAQSVLVETLGYAQYRLSAAEQLAYLADKKAIDVLEKIRTDPASTREQKARATIALARAGRTDVAADLRALIAGDHPDTQAAIELAMLHDESARPVLEKQLAAPTLRVDAARALRRLDPARDQTAAIAPLLAALDGAKDTEQVQLAEAILLLAGPAGWSERE